MKFGIIICRHCHRALGMELRFKSTSCPYCNAKLKVNPADFKYKSSSEKDLADKISKINEKCEINKSVSNNDEEDIGSFNVHSFRTKDLNDEQITKAAPNQSSPEKKGNREVYEKLDPIKRIAIKYKNERESIQLIKNLVQTLGQELGEFRFEDFKELLIECSMDTAKAEKYLEELKNSGYIYEPAPGTFKTIE
jgi:hypothetical protein